MKMQRGTRVFNMYHGRGTIIKILRKPIHTTFGKRGTYLVGFDYPESDQGMNTAQLKILPLNDCGKEIGDKGRGRRLYFPIKN